MLPFSIVILLVNTIGLAGIPLSTIISVVLIYDFGYAKILFNEYFGKKYLKPFALQQRKNKRKSIKKIIAIYILTVKEIKLIQSLHQYYATQIVYEYTKSMTKENFKIVIKAPIVMVRIKGVKW